MFQGFKETVLKKKLNQLLSQTDNRRTLSLEKIKSIAIISTEDISSEMDLQKEIEIILESRNIRIYSLRKYNKSDEFSYKHFTKKNVNWTGQFTEESFKLTGARIGKSPMMFEVPQFESIDIDTPDDWDFANVAARHLMNNKG